MTGIELIKKIKETGLENCEISINFTYDNNSAYIAKIKNVNVECTDLNLFIDIGKIDKIIQYFTMCKSWFTLDKPTVDSEYLMAECPCCGGTCIYGWGCDNCKAKFVFK